MYLYTPGYIFFTVQWNNFIQTSYLVHMDLFQYPQFSRHSFMLKKALIGLSRLDQHIDNRRPITITIDSMKSLVQVSLTVCCSFFEVTLFKVFLTTAFYGYFWIWEYVMMSSCSVLQSVLIISHQHSLRILEL